MRVRRILWAVALLVASTAALVAEASPAEAGGSCGRGTTDRSTNVVLTEEGCFSPTVVRVAVGETLTFAAKDNIEHTVSAPGGAWGGHLPAGGSLKVTFSEPGVYPYFCHLHLGMIGAVVVGDGSDRSQAVGSAVTRLVAASRGQGTSMATGSIPAASLLLVLPVAVGAYWLGRRRRGIVTD